MVILQYTGNILTAQLPAVTVSCFRPHSQQYLDSVYLKDTNPQCSSPCYSSSSVCRPGVGPGPSCLWETTVTQLRALYDPSSLQSWCQTDKEHAVFTFKANDEGLISSDRACCAATGQ